MRCPVVFSSSKESWSFGSAFHTIERKEGHRGRKDNLKYDHFSHTIFWADELSSTFQKDGSSVVVFAFSVSTSWGLFSMTVAVAPLFSKYPGFCCQLTLTVSNKLASISHVMWLILSRATQTFRDASQRDALPDAARAWTSYRISTSPLRHAVSLLIVFDWSC